MKFIANSENWFKFIKIFFSNSEKGDFNSVKFILNSENGFKFSTFYFKFRKINSILIHISVKIFVVQSIAMLNIQGKPQLFLSDNKISIN